MSLLVILGASIIGLLGIAHGWYTLKSSPAGGPMAPTSAEVREAMTKIGGLGLAPDLRTTLWRAWAGFNFSHSLGALAIALYIGIPAALNFPQALSQTWWLVLALVLPWLYLVLSVRYWFRSPTIGIGLAAALITLGIVLGAITESAG